jgi:hypothetical protein
MEIIYNRAKILDMPHATSVRRAFRPDKKPKPQFN